MQDNEGVLMEEGAVELSALRTLWKAVLAQSLADTQPLKFNGNKIPRYETKVRRIAQRRSAINYLRVDNEDFVTVCYLAGHEPEWIVRKFVPATDSPRVVFDARTATTFSRTANMVPNSVYRKIL